MSLARVLDARSVAVVGASRDETKRGHQAIRTLLASGYEGAIYPIHPREESILGLRCYPTVSAVEGPVDLALITTPAATVPGILPGRSSSPGDSARSGPAGGSSRTTWCGSPVGTG